MRTITSKIKTLEQLADIISKEHRMGRRVVFTNGCFDLIHAGHVRYLEKARSQGDALVVGVNSDASVEKIKGSKRPIIPEDQRALVLAALECVDFVIIFYEDDPAMLIERLLPDVLVKGEDWAPERIVGADMVAANGGQVVRERLTPGASSSAIIDKIIALYCTSK